MLRSVVVWGLFALLGVLVLGHDVPVSRAQDKSTASLAAKLHQPVNFPAIDDKTATLQEVLDKISDRCDVKIEVNDAAFNAEMIDDVASKGIAADKPIAKMTNVRLEMALRRILARVPYPGTTYIIRRDAIEITTMKAVALEIWGKDYQGPFLPLVQNTFEKQPLEKVLRELAEETEFTIVLDGRVEDKAKALVSGRFMSTPLDTAVRLLADMAELKPYLVDNVLYVTTKENAALLEEQELKKVKQAQEMGNEPSAPRIGFGRFVRPLLPPVQ